MKFAILPTLLALLAPAAVLAGEPSTLSYDPLYSLPTLSTLSTACSDGANGLHTAGYPTLGSLPRFPLVVASPEIAGWNSPQCGACYKIYYSGTGRSVYAVGVDVGRGGFVGSKEVLDQVTGGRAEAVGRVNVSWLRVESVLCGL